MNRQEIEHAASEAMSKARVQLLLDSKPSAAFLATLAMQLVMTPRWDIDTMSTDGTTLWYNPEFALSLPDIQRQAVIAHEVMHCALLHMFRRGSRDPKLYNIAADHVVNNELTDWDFPLPAGVYCDPQYKGQGVEQVYAKLYASQPPSQNGQGGKQPPQSGQKGPGTRAQSDSGQGEGPQTSPQKGERSNGAEPILPGCPTGDFIDAPPTPQKADEDGNPGPPPMTAEDWAVLAEQAAMAARLAGTMPGGLNRQLKSTRNVETDWREELRQYITRTVPSTQSWSRPNRRYISRGLFLPGPIHENIGKIAIFLDSSGSTWGRLLDVFGEHINKVVEEVQPESTLVIQVDTHVRSIQEFKPGETVRLQAQGGGGTRFNPAFRWLDEQWEQPLCAIYLTDLDNSDRGMLMPPSVPVIWAAPRWVRLQPEFGSLVSVDV